MKMKSDGDKRVRNLANLFVKMIDNSNLVAIHYYQQIFKGSAKIKINNKQGSFIEVICRIVEIINSRFPANNFFFQSNESTSVALERGGFITYNIGENFEDLLQNNIHRKSDSEKGPPQIIFFYIKNLSGDIQTALFVIPHLIKISESMEYEYHLQATIILTKGKDKITKQEINHAYAQCRTQKGWYKIDDKSYEKIAYNEIEDQVYRNNASKVLMFTR